MDYKSGLFICIVVVGFLHRCHAQDKNVGPSTKYREEAIQIINSIFHKYNPGVAPRPHPNPVSLYTHVSLVSLQDIDRDAQYLDSVVDLEIEWVDGRLQWYPVSVRKITVGLDKVWKPDISVVNALEPPVVVSNPDLAVASSGKIYWYRRLQLRTYCQTNSSYTEDPIKCDISIGSRLYHSGEQDFNKTEGFNKFDVSSAYIDNKWEVVGNEISRSERVIEKPMLDDQGRVVENKTEIISYSELHFEMDITRTVEFVRVEEEEKAQKMKMDKTNSGSHVTLTSSLFMILVYISMCLV